jgi:hypothetical protein
MNGQSTETKQQPNRADYKPQWQEAQRCQPIRPIVCEPKKPDCAPPKTEFIRERDSKETFIFMNSAESIQRTSDSNLRSLDLISRLTWGLLGLASLLFLGSMLMMLAYGRSSNTTVKETTNNINKTREVIRVEQSDEDRPPYYPPALW